MTCMVGVCVLIIVSGNDNCSLTMYNVLSIVLNIYEPINLGLYP
jgi:hypothetical protein